MQERSQFPANTSPTQSFSGRAGVLRAGVEVEGGTSHDGEAGGGDEHARL